MRRLPLIIMPLLFAAMIVLSGNHGSDSPHGKSLKYSCEVCHTSSGWVMDENSTFKHSETGFSLTGQHVFINCRDCHPTLVFDEAGTSCMDCHIDMHEQTLGTYCERCHTTSSWLVANILEIHQQGRFPLLGAHALADCFDCHKTESMLRFDPLGITCFECHSEDYRSAQFPDHVAAGYTTSCEECHNINAYEWSSTGINHSFFPLTQGHDIADCAACHNTSDYLAISPDCFECHASDYAGTTNPDHSSGNFPTDCALCHTTSIDWRPAIVDHSFFPLTAGHNISDCAACHTTGDYGAISPDCFGCHASDYESTKNPDHGSGNFSTDCALCHTTNIDWKPATMDHSFFPLEGAHNIDDCLQCHTEGNYAAASPDCFSCHEADYKATTDPNHAGTGFSTECTQCHTTTHGWTPSTFDHNSYFPIYSGRHKGEWNSCSDCHTNASNYNIFSCIECHEHNKNETDSNHGGVNNYVYTATSCYECHPRGEGD